jgi:hypothetical protein
MSMIKLLEPLAACALVLFAACNPSRGPPPTETVGLVISSAMAQELPVACSAFRRDTLGVWFATEALSMNTQIGLIDISPGRVNIHVAEILDANCR